MIRGRNNLVPEATIKKRRHLKSKLTKKSYAGGIQLVFLAVVTSCLIICVLHVTFELHPPTRFHILDDSEHHHNMRRRWSFENVAQHQETALFFHIYLDPTNITFSEEIVNEQIQQIGDSYLVTGGTLKDGLTVYFNTVGNFDVDSIGFKQKMQAKCRDVNIVCIHKGHYNSAWEEVTLQDAYQFCLEHPTRNIIYVHNKGSFHTYDTDLQGNWRKHMIRAVTGELCLRHMNECSTCGLHFQPTWTPFYPGNFFVGRCDYVNLLIMPMEFQNRTASMLLERPAEMIGSIYEEKDDRRGEGRFANEHWIGSHPSIFPCHVSTHPNIETWFVNEGPPFRLMDGSALPLDSEWRKCYKKNREKVLNQKAIRTRDSFLLPGLLWKWYSFYKVYPHQDSWIWKYFPDGMLWRGLLEQYSGDVPKVLDVVWRATPRPP